MPAPRSVVDLLRALVAIPSVNPDGDPGTDQVGEARIGAYVLDFLRSIGAEVSQTEVEPGRANVFGMLKADGQPKRRLVFAPHLDTVTVAGMSISPFDPVVRNGRLYGRGSSDTKGSMAAMLWAIRAWAKSKERKNSGLEITFAGMMGEEAGLVGATAWAKTKPKFDLAIIGEPTGMRVVHAAKGPLWLKLTAKGVACHASQPERGRNAILLMAQALGVVDKRLAPALAKRSHRLLGRSTVNVGLINGGSKVNVVPDICTAMLDLRLIPTWSRTELLKLIRDLFKRESLPITLSVVDHTPPLDVDPRQPLVADLADCLKGTTVAPWTCDATMLARPDQPAVAAGPGSIDQAHTKDEFLRVGDLERGAALFEAYLRRPLA